jgi:prevent-host-death family protein
VVTPQNTLKHLRKSAKCVNSIQTTSGQEFGEVMRRARENGERFIVDKKGESQVVILSIEDYLSNFVKQPSSLKSLQSISRKKGLNKLTNVEIGREVHRIRKQLSGK